MTSLKSSIFPNIPQIAYEGPQSDNPLAFKFYDENRTIGSKTMKEHLRFAVCYWHTFCGDGLDMFGAPTLSKPWDTISQPMDKAKAKLEAAFEFFAKLGVPFYSFHDRDIAPQGANVRESEKNLQDIVALAKQYQQDTNIHLLWGTANVFSHPRYMNGAATNPDFTVVAHAAAQVKAALEATVELGGQCYVFWGGREGYGTLWNTDMKREIEHLARFLTMARDYGRKIGFNGDFLVEPKPMEPSKHQYDTDAATTLGFLRHYGLDKDFKLNIEANHANLANHTFAHDLQVAADAGLLGSIDANRGDYQNGWDTDQFPTNVYEIVEAMMVVLNDGGLKKGGLNFDAKVRRNSTDLEDLFIAHIGGMDAFALGLEIAHKIIEDDKIPALLKKRYASFDSGLGKKFEQGKLTLSDLTDHAIASGESKVISGKQELIENIINQIMFAGR